MKCFVLLLLVCFAIVFILTCNWFVLGWLGVSVPLSKVVYSALIVSVPCRVLQLTVDWMAKGLR